MPHEPRLRAGDARALADLPPSGLRDTQLSTLDLQPSVHLHIERLFLDGFPLTGADAPHLRLALESELADLLRAQPLDTAGLRGQTISSLPVAQLRLDEPSHPRTLGRRAARSLYEMIRREAGSSASGPSPAQHFHNKNHQPLT
ncbi:MAG: hypothetical protein HYY24_08675 [Verrucomicrobia bacterium]|nr:hypothetical protein [Verrucomicrobiota bacterium]